MLIKWKDAPAVIKECFRLPIHPSKGVHVFNHSVLTGTEINTGSYWNDGTRSSFIVKRGDQHFMPPSGSYPRFDGKHEMLAGDVLVKYTQSQKSHSFTIFTTKE